MEKFFILLCLFTFFAAPAYAGNPTTTSMASIPLDQPNMDDEKLSAWAAGAASQVMTFDAQHYQQQLQRSSKFFTKVGWETFAAALQRSRLLDAVAKQNQTISAGSAATPEVIEKGVVNGMFQWKVKVPLRVNYRTWHMGRTDTLQLVLVVSRVKAFENPDGIGIALWTAK